MKNTLPLLVNVADDLVLVKKYQSPLLILFSQAECRFCHEVRNNYLSPLYKSYVKNQLIIRELIVDEVSKIIGTDGRLIETTKLLKSLHVRFFPTVVFIGAGMKEIAEPLVGLDQAGFYGAYLDQRIHTAMKNI
jgi:thioredoxin-related protein